ncbi:hypothetical protein [Anabaena sp. CA = ATCC 33047]|uniref:hypothetical protein n=1 Tax=Anabaena sp. (strain CA / ATCC 33047) TaxID=52271 RepID=UPI000AF1D3F9|nr:hypothetical protein [Anabaena sp. CA = ATCC 33047]
MSNCWIKINFTLSLSPCCGVYWRSLAIQGHKTSLHPWVARILGVVYLLIGSVAILVGMIVLIVAIAN